MPRCSTTSRHSMTARSRDAVSMVARVGLSCRDVSDRPLTGQSSVGLMGTSPGCSAAGGAPALGAGGRRFESCHPDADRRRVILKRSWAPRPTRTVESVPSRTGGRVCFGVRADLRRSPGPTSLYRSGAGPVDARGSVSFHSHRSECSEGPGRSPDTMTGWSSGSSQVS
jgi:hypothetical protein